MWLEKNRINNNNNKKRMNMEMKIIMNTKKHIVKSSISIQFKQIT